MSQSPEDVPIDAEVVDDSTALALPDPAQPLAPDYTDDGVPTLDYVRNQIEGRFATSIGAAELAADASHATSIDDQFAERERAGKDRLAQIRRAMREEQTP
jgi:phage shock protein A